MHAGADESRADLPQTIHLHALSQAADAALLLTQSVSLKNSLVIAAFRFH